MADKDEPGITGEPFDPNKSEGRKSKDSYGPDPSIPTAWDVAKGYARGLGSEDWTNGVPGWPDDLPRPSAVFNWPQDVQNSVRRSLIQRIKASRINFPAWADDAAGALPVLEFVAFFFTAASLAVTAEIAKQPWLIPVSAWAAGLGVIVFALDWRARYLRNVKHNRRAATVAVLCNCVIFLIMAYQILWPIAGHLKDANPSAFAGHTAANPSALPKTEASVAAQGGLTYRLIHRSPKPTQLPSPTPLPTTPSAPERPAPQEVAAPSIPATKPPASPPAEQRVALMPDSYVDARPSGLPTTPDQTIVTFKNRGSDLADNFCFWIFPILASDDARHLEIELPSDVHNPVPIRLFPGDTEPSSALSTFVQLERPWLAKSPVTPISALYVYHSYTNGHSQLVQHSDLFLASANGFFPVRSSLVQPSRIVSQINEWERESHRICSESSTK